MAVANDQVSIVTACQLIGMAVPDDVGYGRSRKLHCPFGPIYHSDHGYEPAFRIYPDSNSGFCFAGCGYFSPVWLAAQAWGQEPSQAAVALLDRIGYKPISLAQAWADVAGYEPKPDIAALATALKIFCARVCPGWLMAQFEPEIATPLTRCLALLDLVTTQAQADEWLSGCKKVMSRALARHHELR